jgi:acyl-[acyl-carrier-protein]-phospholipid O-acyltransferase / long-chain-fatty-acid--[acyl-carrier-protein] ligase
MIHDRSALLPIQLIQECKHRGQGLKAADSTGARLSGSDLLLRSLVLRRLLLRHVLQPDEQNVAVLLPPSVPAVVVNFALCFAGRTSVNLNYTASSSILNQCLDLAKIRHVLTSRKVMEKLDLKLDAELIYLEDYKEKATLGDKLAGFVGSRFMPSGMLARSLKLHLKKPDDPLTIIFTSGSTGTPKGVVLSYKNVGHNVRVLEQALSLKETDIIVGILPFFHSFGYTVTLWAAQALNLAGVYHYSPLDARQIGKLASEHKATILLGTPTFLRTYMRRIDKEMFQTMEMVIVGAEKLPATLSDAFEQHFGIRPIEGYGMTELSPLVSVNLPPKRSKATDETKGLREGSVGRPLPEVEARVVSLDNGQVLEPGQTGMLQVRGPNLMTGYLNRPDLTAQSMRGDWYETGDVALIDAEGFIHITGRQSRFSKIGGEMIPHIQIEEAIQGVLGSDSDGLLSAVVTAVPDDKRGERLVVLHTPLSMTPGEILKKLSEAGLPNIYLPSEDSFVEVTAIPVLGTGKLDLKAMKQMALDKLGMG